MSLFTTVPSSVEELLLRLRNSLVNQPASVLLKVQYTKVCDLMRRRSELSQMISTALTQPTEEEFRSVQTLQSIDKELDTIHNVLIGCGGFTYQPRLKSYTFYQRYQFPGDGVDKSLMECWDWLRRNNPDQVIDKWKALLQPIINHPNFVRAHYNENQFQMDLAESLHLWFGMAGHFYRIESLFRSIYPYVDHVNLTHRGCTRCSSTVLALECKELQQTVGEISDWEKRVTEKFGGFMKLLDEAVAEKYNAAKELKHKESMKVLSKEKSRVYAKYRKMKGQHKQERQDEIHALEREHYNRSRQEQLSPFEDPDVGYGVNRFEMTKVLEDVDQALKDAKSFGDRNKVELTNTRSTNSLFESFWSSPLMSNDARRYYVPSGVWYLGDILRPKARHVFILNQIATLIRNKQVDTISIKDIIQSQNPIFSPFERNYAYHFLTPDYISELSFDELKRSGLYRIHTPQMIRLFREGDVYVPPPNYSNYKRDREEQETEAKENKQVKVEITA